MGFVKKRPGGKWTKDKEPVPVLVRLAKTSTDRFQWVDAGWLRILDCTSLPEMQKQVHSLKEGT